MYTWDRVRKYIILTIISFSIVIFIGHVFNSYPYQHFAVQSQSFLQGRLNLHFTSFLNDQDFVIKDGKYYWPQGPFPSVILMPFQFIFGESFNQWIMQIILFTICLFILIKLTHKYGYSSGDSVYLLLAFFIGSPILSLITNPSSSQYAQVVAFTLLLVLILEFLSLKRPIIMGLLLGGILATRPTAGIIGLLILFLLLKNKAYKKIFLFMAPIAIVTILLFCFNGLRFGNILDNGYHTAISPNQQLEEFRKEGLFSVLNIPENIYYYFLASVKFITSSDLRLTYPFITYNPWGLSFFVVSPIFIYTLIYFKRNISKTANYWCVVLLTLFILLSYYHPGFGQFGPRYTADFLPVFFVILLISIKDHKLSQFQKNLVLCSCIFNLYLLTYGLGFYLKS